MRCILCDRCREIVRDERKIKIVTFAKSLRPGPVRADSPASVVDHIWTKELCPACSDELENFMNQTTSSGTGDDTSEEAPDTDGEATD